MSALIRLVLFVPIVFMISLVLSAPRSRDVQSMVRHASARSVRIYFWTAVVLVGLEVFSWLLLP